MCCSRQPFDLVRDFKSWPQLHVTLTVGGTLNTNTHFEMIFFYHEQPSMYFFCVALQHKSTAMVMAGRSVHLTKLYPGQA